MGRDVLKPFVMVSPEAICDLAVADVVNASS
jgi:hypothetical protein